jgi:hypothetical protein
LGCSLRGGRGYNHTHRGLTNPNDRATAILGLAQYLSLNSDVGPAPGYPAGLWKQDLAKSLLWYVRLGAEIRPLVTRAPTWFWLSVQGGIVNDSAGLRVATSGVEIEHVEKVRPRRTSALASNGFQDISPTLAEGSFVQLSGKVKHLICILPAPNCYSSSADIDVDRYPALLSNAVLGALSTASDYAVGPHCYPLLMDADGPCVGWYVPDCTVGLGFHENLHCFCLTVEPSTAKDKEDFTQPWAMRGLALRPIEGRDLYGNSDDTVPAYERVGYFELEWRITGAYLPYDSHHFRDLPNNVRRVPPEIDPHGVSKDCEPRTLRLY